MLCYLEPRKVSITILTTNVQRTNTNVPRDNIFGTTGLSELLFVNHSLLFSNFN